MPGRARSETVRLAGRALTLSLLLLLSAPAMPASAESRGAATQDGWWNRLQGPAEGEPEGNPIRPLVPAVPKPPSVPADAIAAGVTAGQVDKVAAIGIDVIVADGSTFEGLTLRLQESATDGANIAADKAKVIACPATVPWGSGQNAAWRDRPAADCGLGTAEGARAADGTWTFDLGAMGRQWADPFAPLPAYGVVLSIDPTSAPSAAQVSWMSFDSGGVAVELAATPPVPGSSDDAASLTPDPATAAAPVPTGPSAETATGLNVPIFGAAAPDPLAYASAQPAFTDVTPSAADPSQSGTVPETPAEATLAAPAAGPGPAPPSRPAVDFWERLPAPTALLVPVAVGLAILVGVALGPAGRPAPVHRREGGLSRALTRRSGAGSDAA